MQYQYIIFKAYAFYAFYKRVLTMFNERTSRRPVDSRMQAYR